jgi:hypothetical protein
MILFDGASLSTETVRVGRSENAPFAARIPRTTELIHKERQRQN